MSNAGPPRGPAGGALAGDWPFNASLGLASMMGLAWFEDFCAVDNAGRYGEKSWLFTGTGTGTIATVGSTSTLQHEVGLRRLQVASSGDRAVLHQDMAARWFRRGPPVGTLWFTKLRHNTSTDGATLWAGLADSTTMPDGPLANSVDFVGIRNLGGAPGEWFGVARSGIVETSVGLTIAGSVLDSEYLIAGWLRTPSGYQFFTAGCSDRSVPPFTTNTIEQTASLPTSSLSPVIGIESTAGGVKGLVVDTVNLAGRTRRG